MLFLHTYLPLLDPKTSILLQKLHPYTGNLNSETPGHAKNVFLHQGDVSVLWEWCCPCAAARSAHHLAL